jgi:hypothetical protein
MEECLCYAAIQSTKALDDIEHLGLNTRVYVYKAPQRAIVGHALFLFGRDE